MVEEKAPADLVKLRERFKALSADILWLSNTADPGAAGAEVASATYALGKSIDEIIAKRSTRSYGVEQDDPELVKFLAGVVGCVEADSYATHMLWTEFAAEAVKHGYQTNHIRFEWKQEAAGTGRQVGAIDGFPVMISMFVNVIGGQRILFYDAPSRVVDHEMIRDWLKANLPPSAFRSDGYINNTNANNFINILDRAKAIEKATA